MKITARHNYYTHYKYYYKTKIHPALPSVSLPEPVTLYQSPPRCLILYYDRSLEYSKLLRNVDRNIVLHVRRYAKNEICSRK
jgi:hypothetical protein